MKESTIQPDPMGKYLNFTTITKEDKRLIRMWNAVKAKEAEQKKPKLKE